VEIIIFSLVGALVGILSGLFGVGGGLIIVPILMTSYIDQGLTSYVMPLAIGTSLGTIVFTSLSSIYAYNKKKYVSWNVFLLLLPGVIIGGLLGSLVASNLSDMFLKLLFGVFEIIVGLKFWFNTSVSSNHKVYLTRFLAYFSGLVISFLSTLLGIGGGTMSVPFFKWLGLSMHKSIATSAAVGFPIALFATIGFISTGWNIPELPSNSIGFVNLNALLPIVFISMLFAPLGVFISHKISAHLLQKMFAILLIVFGLRMLLSIF